MTRYASSAVEAAASPAPSLRAIAQALVETTKPRITRLVTITSGVGFALAALTRSWEPATLAWSALGALVGTGLSAAGANALNQWAERDRDALMPRTCVRPLPQQRLAPGAVLVAGLILCLAGVGLLWLATGRATPAIVSAVTIATYLLLYTPLKPVTPLATIVGAVPGALPPLIGWTAAAADPTLNALRDPGPWSLFLIMFVWQIPHFLAIAWMYREDYARGRYRVLPVVDPTGTRTAFTTLAWSVLFLPVALSPALLLTPRAGALYIAIALVTGVLFLGLVLRWARERTRSNARAAFIASVIHLPLLLIALVADAGAARIF